MVSSSAITSEIRENMNRQDTFVKQTTINQQFLKLIETTRLTDTIYSMCMKHGDGDRGSRPPHAPTKI